MAKILIVDDDALMVRMYQGKFQDDGFDVAVGVDGEDGFNKAVEFKPDLILLDIMMPKMDGLTMLKNLKTNAVTKNIPVILLTNVGGGDEDVEKGFSLGAVAYLVKAHYDVKDVVKKVKEILGGYIHELPKVEVQIKVEDKKKNEEKEKVKKDLVEIQQKLDEAKKRLEKAS